MPVVIEDRAFVGSRCIVVEGVRVEEEAVLGANVVLTGSTQIIDVTGPEEVVHRGRVPPAPWSWQDPHQTVPGRLLPAPERPHNRPPQGIDRPENFPKRSPARVRGERLREQLLETFSSSSTVRALRDRRSVSATTWPPASRPPRFGR